LRNARTFEASALMAGDLRAGNLLSNPLDAMSEGLAHVRAVCKLLKRNLQRTAIHRPAGMPDY
jgi:hypothetical protein